MVGAHGRRPLASALVTGAVLLALVTACSSGSQHHHSTPNPNSTAANSARFISAPALLTQCAINRGIKNVISSAQRYNKLQPASHRWLNDTSVHLTFANGGAFQDWYQNAPNFNVGGRSLLSNWPRIAASQGKLPQAVCGPGVSAKQLYVQVYAHWPSMLKHNPWS